jgi:hypothetical protein
VPHEPPVRGVVTGGVVTGGWVTTVVGGVTTGVGVVAEGAADPALLACPLPQPELLCTLGVVAAEEPPPTPEPFAEGDVAPDAFRADEGDGASTC